MRGQVYNCYSAEDAVLGVVYRLANGNLSEAAGYGPIPLKDKGLVNMDCSAVVEGHLRWKNHFGHILEHIRSIS